MKDERWQKISGIFNSALERTAEERAAYLSAACAHDDALRREVESLLAAYSRTGQLIDAPAIEAAAPLLADQGEKLSRGQSIINYRVIEQIGEGGMGEVYLALDMRLGRKVALKLLPSYFTKDEGRLRRFRQEACAASALNHPNIITVYEIGETEDRQFIATELIEGVTLRQHLKSRRIKLGDALDISVQAASALTAAHAAGIVHRDIKPENIMLRADGYVKVLDFGLAKTTERRVAPSDADADTQMMIKTDPGVVMGTISYMSPEQARGLEVDERTDIWSLGCVIYEMVAGCLPFEGGTTAEIAASILGDDEPAPLARYSRDVPAELERIVTKALCKEREERYQTAKDLLIDLKNLKQELEFETKLQRKEAHRTVSREMRQQQSSETLVEEDAPFISRPDANSAEAAHAVQRRTEIISPETTRDEQRKRETVELPVTASVVWWKRASTRIALASVVVLVLAGGGLWYYWRSANLKWARLSVTRIEELAKSKNYFEAYDLAVKVQKYLPNDPTIARLMPTLSDDLTVTTEPAGARVYLKRFSPDQSGNFPARQLVGTTPLNNLRIARGDYILSLERDGYAQVERTISGQLWTDGDSLFIPPPLRVETKLVEAARVPDRMVLVAGGDYRIVAWRRPTDKRVQLDEFLIDRYEVSNQEYKEFINAGGYLKKQFWKYPLIKEGRAVPWEEAMREFVDRTGLPGPRSWSSQNFPQGMAAHPVTDINWYEAAAYAAFRGKQLPTIFQWEKAARNGANSFAGLTMPWGILGDTTDYRANFKGRGTMPVDSMEFGMSPYGAFNMAGNVSEWCLNETSQAFITSGGSWEDPFYLFGYYGAFPGFYSSNKLGFRCVLNQTGSANDQGAMKISLEDEVPNYTPASEASVASFLRYYEYEHTPLEPQLVEVKETDEWRREKITYNGAGGERALAYLYLPKNFQGPLQVINFMPASDVFNRARSLPDSIEANLSAHIKSGRAVFGVVLKGFLERDQPKDYKPSAPTTIEYVEDVAQVIIDVRRGLDYLETREDIDSGKIAYFAPSSAGFKLIVPAVDMRYRSVILQGSGLRGYMTQMNGAANPINFVGRIRAPKLMLHGRYDEAAPLKTEAEPLYKLLREPKRLTVFEGGHIPAPQVFVPALNNWLDETLGPVRRE
jgi:serine/threonine protein kinase/formylglycine-generating enzyme required for sulfatase activity